MIECACEVALYRATTHHVMACLPDDVVQLFGDAIMIPLSPSRCLLFFCCCSFWGICFCQSFSVGVQSDGNSTLCFDHHLLWPDIPITRLVLCLCLEVLTASGCVRAMLVFYLCMCLLLVVIVLTTPLLMVRDLGNNNRDMRCT